VAFAASSGIKREWYVWSTSRHAIHFQFEISANALAIRALQSPKCIVCFRLHVLKVKWEKVVAFPWRLNDNSRQRDISVAISGSVPADTYLMSDHSADRLLFPQMSSFTPQTPLK
jgi:hypothetical protein